jgi:hypothetical protein
MMMMVGCADRAFEQYVAQRQAAINAASGVTITNFRDK